MGLNQPSGRFAANGAWLAVQAAQMANWYWKVVRQFVSERFGISVSRGSCLKYLHRLGFALKRPKKRLLKADEAKR